MGDSLSWNERGLKKQEDIRAAQAGARGAEGQAKEQRDVEVRDDHEARRREGDERLRRK